MDAPTLNQPRRPETRQYKQEQLNKTYSSWQPVKQSFYKDVLRNYYQQLAHQMGIKNARRLKTDTKKAAQLEVTEMIDALDVDSLNQKQKDKITKDVAAWIKESQKTKDVVKKILPPTKEMIKAAEDAIIAQKNPDAAKQKPQSPKKQETPQKPLPEQPNEVKAEKAVREKKIDSLQDQFQLLTDELETKIYMTGTVENQFARLLKDWKTMIKDLQGQIISAQNIKNTLKVLWKVLDQKDQYDKEFVKIFSPMWETQKNLKSFVAQNEKSWGEMLDKLIKTRRESDPEQRYIPKESRQAFEKMSKPTSSETNKDTEPVKKTVNETEEIEEALKINFYLSLWCYTQLKVHTEKIKHRINEINEYLIPKCMQKYKTNYMPPAEHILRCNNHQKILDKTSATLAKVLTAKEYMDLVLEGLELIGNKNNKAYKDIVAKYEVLFKTEVANLKNETKIAFEIIKKTNADLDRVISEESIEPLPTSTMESLRKIHKDNPDRLKEIESMPKTRQERKKAATTQKRILEAFGASIHDRMYVNSYRSKAVVPRYIHFAAQIKSLQG